MCATSQDTVLLLVWFPILHPRVLPASVASALIDNVLAHVMIVRPLRNSLPKRLIICSASLLREKPLRFVVFLCEFCRLRRKTHFFLFVFLFFYLVSVSFIGNGSGFRISCGSWHIFVKARERCCFLPSSKRKRLIDKSMHQCSLIFSSMVSYVMGSI